MHFPQGNVPTVLKQDVEKIFKFIVPPYGPACAVLYVENAFGELTCVGPDGLTWAGPEKNCPALHMSFVHAFSTQVHFNFPLESLPRKLGVIKMVW